jgi:uncharacterized membrane protein YkvA (DUF1232 family)
MSEKEDRKIIPTDSGFLNNLAQQLKLIFRLLGDKRVSPLLKLLPIGSALYFVSPIDLALGPLDDAAVIWLATYLFVELCPPEVVEEHKAALRGQALPGEWPGAGGPGAGGPAAEWPGSQPGKDDVIEGEFWEKKD